MGTKEQVISQLLGSSKQVLLDCVLPNGAVVAANTDHPSYPIDANDYRHVWPRDASYILYALGLLGNDKTPQFCDWMLGRAEGFMTSGLFYRRYATNGACSWPEEAFQPDQAGALLWSLTSAHSQDERVQRVIHQTATALCRSWNTDHFTSETHDLWEHMRCGVDQPGFTYSLAACSFGLQSAADQYPSEGERWRQVATQMHDILEQSESQGYFTRIGLDTDGHVDGSLSGLIWPFKTTSNPDVLKATLQKIEDDLLTPEGVKRFTNDPYDGIIKRALDLNQGAGAWPLLTCWLAIAWSQLGQEERAHVLFDQLLDRLPADFIPEQLFTDDRIGITPLGWSHAMFVIACSKLGYLRTT